MADPILIDPTPVPVATLPPSVIDQKPPGDYVTEAAAVSLPTDHLCRSCARPMASRVHEVAGVLVWTCVNTNCWLSY